MKYPLNIKIVYVPCSNLPINTVDSTHLIEDDSDLDVVVGFINVFSEVTWNDDELLHAINDSKLRCITNTKLDSSLHVYVF